MTDQQASRKTIPVDELAAQLGVSRNFAYQQVRKGGIPAVRVGKRWLVPADAADQILAAASKRQELP